jgi:hypothetical protein
MTYYGRRPEIINKYFINTSMGAPNPMVVFVLDYLVIIISGRY